MRGTLCVYQVDIPKFGSLLTTRHMTLGAVASLLMTVGHYSCQFCFAPLILDKLPYNECHDVEPNVVKPTHAQQIANSRVGDCHLQATGSFEACKRRSRLNLECKASSSANQTTVGLLMTTRACRCNIDVHDAQIALLHPVV